jgi:hypothetical protein
MLLPSFERERTLSSRPMLNATKPRAISVMKERPLTVSIGNISRAEVPIIVPRIIYPIRDGSPIFLTALPA